MKKNNQKFEKNIERLVKLSAKSDQPPKAFVENLIDDALDLLNETGKSPQPKQTAPGFTLKYSAAVAASILIICGLSIFFLAPNNKDNRNLSKTNSSSDQVANKDASTNQMVPLALDLPKPVAGGTERIPKVQNLQPVPESQRPPFYVPKGTENIALGKPVTGSDENPIGGTLAKITDGDKSGTDGSYIEMGLFDQFVTIDLGKKYNIYAIVLWHYFAQTRVYFDVVVQTADDPDFIKNVTTLFNNDTDNSLGLGIGKDKNYIETRYGKLINAKGTPARYIRLYSCGNDVNELNHYIEVQVYANP